jgi:hypothetical protein
VPSSSLSLYVPDPAQLNQNYGMRKKRSSSTARQASRTSPSRQKLSNNWLPRLGRPLGRQSR